jgi:DNA-binding CsgD family transcriptional regulator
MSSRPGVTEIHQASAEAQSLAGLAHTVMPLLEQAFGTSASCFYRCGADGRIQQLRGSLGELDAYTDGLYASDPLQRAMRQQNPWIAHCSRFVVWTDYTRLPVYEFSLRQGLNDYMVLRLTDTGHDAPGLVGILVARALGQAHFGEREEELAGRILPALTALVRRAARRAEPPRPEGVLEILVDREGPPKLALTEDGDLLWASSRARALLGLERGAAPAPGALAAAARRLTAGDPEGAPPLTRVPRPSGVPLFAELSLVRPPSGERFVLAELQVHEVSPELGALARSARLTEAECEVLSLLSLGLTNREIAARRFVSVDTVHTHVGRVLHKLGVRTRAQALLVARGLAPRHRG